MQKQKECSQQEPTSKNYRLYDPERRKIVISYDISFNEKVAHRVITKEDSIGVEDRKEEIEEDSTNASREEESNELKEEKNITEKPNKKTSRYELRVNPKPAQRYDPADYYASYASIMDEPTSFEKAIESKDAEEWKEAIRNNFITKK